MLNFTVGPVQMEEQIREIGAEQIPYFRTEEFSDLMLENERLMKKLAKADEDARAVFITGSGTASMEAAVINTLTEKDQVLIVNGGSFGERFVQICSIHSIPYVEVKLDPGKKLTEDMLRPFEHIELTAFAVNMHETSTGVLYDMELISRFCRDRNLLLIVDMISAFLADEFNMKELRADVVITGSQKALACPPGMSVILLSDRAVQRVRETDCKCMYLNLQDALTNGERGQTPFTPAVGILLQIHERLKQIEEQGGTDAETKSIAGIAEDFRKRIKDLPFTIVSESLSNAVTPLHPLTASAYHIFEVLKNEYGIWVCPNGGRLRDEIFRVGHIGALTAEDNKKLISALEDMQRRGII